MSSLKHMRNPSSFFTLIMVIAVALIAGCVSQSNTGGFDSKSDQPHNTAGAADPQSASSDAARQASGEVREEVEVRTVKHSLGSTDIPAEPKRIAITHQILIDWLHPLGYKVSVAPMARPDRDFEPYTPEAQKQDLTLIGPPGDPNLEALLQQEPDLIFVNWGHDKAYEQLNKIAPSIFVAFRDDWRDLLREYGRMLGKEQEAEQWLDAYRQKAEKAKAELAGLADQTVVFIRFLPREMRIYANHPTSSVGGVLYHDLGLKPVSEPGTDTMFEAISLEGLAQLNPDHIFMQIGFVPESDEEARKRYEDLTSGAVWQGINAVKKNQVYLVESAFFSNSPLAKEYAIDVVLQHLLK